jgi:Ca2+-binding RTX toxin-like protein
LIALGLFAPIHPAAGSPTAAIDTWNIKAVDLPVTHIAYIASRDVLVATVGDDQSALGNDLVEIDPATGSLGRNVYVGSRPSNVAVSDDGSVAYVGFDGANAIAKVDLATFTVSQTFSTGHDSYGATRVAADLDVPPGRSDVVVAALQHSVAISPPGEGVFAYKDGVLLPHAVYYSDDRVAFVDSTTAYSTEAGGTPGYLSKLTFDDNGLTRVWNKQAASSIGDLVATAGSMVTPDGDLIDPVTPAVVRSFAAHGPVAPNGADDTVSFVDGTTFTQFAMSTGAPIQSRDFAELANATQLVGSATGFAVVTNAGLELVGPSVTSDAVTIPSGPSSNLDDLALHFVSVRANDMVFVSARHELYASVAASDLNYGGKLVAINASTGEVEDALNLGGSPHALAASDDGSTLYVSLDSQREVARVDLDSFSEVQHFGIGTEYGIPGYYANDIAVMPGTTDTIAVAREYNGSHRGNALVKNGVVLPSFTGLYTGGDRIEFADATTLYGLVTFSTAAAFDKLTAASDGLHLDWDKSNVVDEFLRDFEVTSAKAWMTDGRVFDPASADLVARVGDGGEIEPMLAQHRIFQLRGSEFREYDDNYRLLATRDVGHVGYGPLVSTGAGFAAVTSDGVVVMGPPACEGKPATIDAVDGHATGTPGDDVIVGTPDDDVIDGGGGSDTICGWGGNDVITGGDGDDTLIGGTGADTLLGDAGSDDLQGSAGNDVLEGGDGADNLAGDTGIDTVRLGGDAVPHIVDIDNRADDGRIGEGDNVRTTIETIVGSPGADWIVGSAGPNSLFGGAGNDRISGGDGNDALNGGDGNDVVSGDTGADTLSGGAGNDRLLGGSGNDSLTGSSGSDDIDGGDGRDTVYLGTSALPHRVDLDNVADDGVAGEADNVHATNEVIVGSPGPDTIIGADGAQLLRGGAGDDVLAGLGGDDRLDGGDGNDTLAGGVGNDVCVPGTGTVTDYGCETTF